MTVETYQWFVRNAGNISSAYTVVICDEAHTALGEKTAAAIRDWTGPIFIGMTATGALIARHVTDLFPTQTSRFDLAQAARRGVISPLRCVRIPPGPGVRTIAKVPLRRGEVDTEFDQEMLAELLDQLPFNLAAANLYKTRFNGLPGVVYAAGVRHAYNLAEAFREEGIKAEGVSGETPKRQLAEILAKYERGDIDVLVNAQLLAEGWNSPRATVCFHLAPTASKRIYQQRVGRVTRRHPGKESGIVVDFVHPGTKHDDPVVTLHSLLDRDVYRGGAIVVGPVRRGRGRRVRVERRVLPVASDENRRIEVFERELWRIAVENLDWGEQIQWAALGGARVAPSGWRRARAMLHFDRSGELKRTFLLTAVQRNKNPQLRLRALQEIAAARDPEAFDVALDEVGGWPREEKREACKTMLQALAEKRIGRRDQADAWIWRVAGFTAELHEEYAVQRWPETKRLLGLLANSCGGGHARNARRLVHAARKQDRRLSAALLAAATRYTHTPEAEEILRGARTRMARKPSSLSRELLRNFPKGRRGRRPAPQEEGRRRSGDGGGRHDRRRRGRAGGRSSGRSRRGPEATAATDDLDDDDVLGEDDDRDELGERESEELERRGRRGRRGGSRAGRGGRSRPRRAGLRGAEAEAPPAPPPQAGRRTPDAATASGRRHRGRAAGRRNVDLRARRTTPTATATRPCEAQAAPLPSQARAAKDEASAEGDETEPPDDAPSPDAVAEELPRPRRARRKTAASSPEVDAAVDELRGEDDGPSLEAVREDECRDALARPAQAASLRTRRPARPSGARSGVAGGAAGGPRRRPARPRSAAASGRGGGPSSSTPAATPSPADHAISLAEQGVALAPGLDDPGVVVRQPRRELAQHVGQHPLDVGGLEAEARRAVVQLLGQVGDPDGDVDADAHDGPALLRPALDEDARDLAPVDEDVVRPLDPRLGAAGVRDRDGGDERQQRPGVADDDATSAARGPGGAVQARPWRPRPALCVAAVTSVPCGAPASASSRARRFVESVDRRCRRGVPITGRPAAAAARRRARGPSGRRPIRG